MKTISNAFRSRQVRKLGVAVAIAGAAAAVAASVVMAERPDGERLLPPSASAELVTGSAAFGSDGHAQIRSPKDAGRLMPAPWVKRARAEAAADVEQPGASLTMPIDVSLPSAGEALKDVAAETGAAAPTF